MMSKVEVQPQIQEEMNWFVISGGSYDVVQNHCLPIIAHTQFEISSLDIDKGNEVG